MKRNCRKCKEYKFHLARGLCHTCYDQCKKNNTLQEYETIHRLGGKRICKRCNRMKKIHGKGMCDSCYVQESTIRRQMNGNKFVVGIPTGKKKEAAKFYETELEKLMKDLGENPRKWLDEC